MAIEQSAEEVAESMRDNPEDWAEMYIELQQHNKELQSMLNKELQKYIGVKH